MMTQNLASIRMAGPLSNTQGPILRPVPSTRNDSPRVLNDQQRSASPVAEIIQPQANNRPQGQLASFLRGRIDPSDSPGKDISRSSSAPPTQVLQNSMEEDVPQPGDPRLDPEYHAYFHANSRLEPRLPPPLYSPGQSWQHWAATGVPGNMRFNEYGTEAMLAMQPQYAPEQHLHDQALLRELLSQQQQQQLASPVQNTLVSQPLPQPAVGSATAAAIAASRKKNLVDMIQEDFPRTPSPLFSGSRFQRAQQQGLQLNGARSRSPVVDLEKDTGEDEARHVKSVLNVAMDSKDDSKIPFNRARLSPPPRSSSTPPSNLYRQDNRNRTSSMSSLRQTISQEDLDENDASILQRLREIDLNDDLFYSNARRFREEGYGMQDVPHLEQRASYMRGFSQDSYGDVWDMDQRTSRMARSSGSPMFGGSDLMGKFDASYLAAMRQTTGHRDLSPKMDRRPNGRFAPVRQPSLNGRTPKLQSDSGLDLSETRSPILEEFRASKKRYELVDLVGHIVLFSGDQHGSRFIQQKLETASPEEKQMVFDEIIPSCVTLMNDVFGNYVIQKFFEFGTPAQRTVLAKHLEGQVFVLSLQMYGCRVVQKALEHLDSDWQARFVHELEGHVMKCVKDQNGNHVIQKAIEKVCAADIQFIIDGFHGHVYQLATHPYGCRVIQRIFEHCVGPQVRPLMDELHKHSVQLIQDQYGNYVIQHVLEHGKPVDKSMVVGKVRGQVLTLSKHKFASNVIEKCIMYGTKRDRQILVEEVMQPKPDGTCPLLVMMKDQFANYVVQKMLDCVEDDYRQQLVVRIRPHLPALRKVAYGKHLITKVEKFMAANS